MREYEPTGLAEQTHNDRYALGDEPYDMACSRVAHHVARAESDQNNWGQQFFRIMSEGLFSPGGRIWYGAGRPNAQLLNCFVLPVSDSREGWGQLFYDTTVVSGTGGGIGVNFGAVRGADYPIRGTGGVASGAVSVMHMQSGLGHGIVQGGSRRTALMQSLPLNHPDIREFLNVKKDREALTNANLSIIIPKSMPTYKLLEAIKNGDEIPLEWEGKPDRFGRTINATELWETIVHNAWENGEPGVLNQYLANRESNISHRYDLSTTNPCGEIWLPEYGCCCLGALVLPRFISGGQVDWQLLEQTVTTSIRFLDDVLSVNQYPLDAIKQMCQAERRIGLGVMGLHSMMLDLGMKYSASSAFVGDLFRFIRDSAYRASIDLAKEKGAYPLYTPQHLASDFSRRLPKSIRAGIKEHGIRNVAMLTIAPTGTTSMVQGVTAGIEPVYSPVYIKTVREKGKKTKRTLVISQDYADHTDICEGALDIPVESHFAVQTAAQPYVDNAVSKTINLAKDYPVENLSKVWRENLEHLKGTTLYRDGSRANQPNEHVPFADTLDVIASWKGPIDNQGNFSVEACRNGVCEI